MIAEKTQSEAPAPADVLEIVQGLARELQPQRGARAVSLDSSLERDLGFDSLGRVELLARLEKGFGVRLPEDLLGAAETPRDLLAALAVAHPAAAPGEGFQSIEPLGGGEAAPDRTRTLLEVLDWHAGRHPGRRHILYYPGDGEPEELTYGELARRVRAAAAELTRLGVGPGKAVGIMLPTGLEYFVAFFGAQLAGGIPVPLYPPARKSQIEDHLRRQAGILRTAGAEVLVTFPEVLTLARLLSAQLPVLHRVVTVAELAATSDFDVDRFLAPPVRGEDIAFLQFTSGSTGNPKGVMLTHANLLANLRAIRQGADIRPDDVIVSWLPLYHDMGLIGCWMGALYFGVPLVLMSPLAFLARPSRWLWAIHRHRGTLSAAPNFAYELCINKIPEEEIEGLDLSSWRMALNGAEPVSPEALRRFIERFETYGFRPGSFSPVYGLAENSLAVAFPPLGRPPLIDAVEREPFQRSGSAVPAAADDPGALRFVSCGTPLVDHEIRIVDDAGREVGERQEGRLEFKGPSATSGYFRNPEATAKLVHGDWRDSGDRAYIAGGEVYITGRVKDIIIRAGRNLYPQELEGAVGEVPGIRKGCVAVFGSPDPATGTERLVVMAETRERDDAALETIRQAVQEVTVDLLGTPAEVVALVPPHGVPKTSSGKIRRSSAREVFESGRSGRGGASLGLQIAASGRLGSAGAGRAPRAFPGRASLQRLGLRFGGAVRAAALARGRPDAGPEAPAAAGAGDRPLPVHLDRHALPPGGGREPEDGRAADRGLQPRELSGCDRADRPAAAGVRLRGEARVREELHLSYLPAAPGIDLRRAVRRRPERGGDPQGAGRPGAWRVARHLPRGDLPSLPRPPPLPHGDFRGSRGRRRAGGACRNPWHPLSVEERQLAPPARPDERYRGAGRPP